MNRIKSFTKMKENANTFERQDKVYFCPKIIFVVAMNFILNCKEVLRCTKKAVEELELVWTVQLQMSHQFKKVSKIDPFYKYIIVWTCFQLFSYLQ